MNACKKNMICCVMLCYHSYAVHGMLVKKCLTKKFTLPIVRCDAKWLDNKDRFGVEQATTAQTWNGVLGNFTFNHKQPSQGFCTIQDYLCKYIARDLQIFEHDVVAEATFTDIKKAFNCFLQHNHPDTILKDFQQGLITKQHAKDALQFTGWVIGALEKYLNNCNDDSYKKELCEFCCGIKNMKNKVARIKFVDNGEWNSSTRE